MAPEIIQGPRKALGANMPDIMTMLSQKEQEYAQLLKMRDELQQNLQAVTYSLLRTEGAIVALKAIAVQEVSAARESVNGCVPA
jgi:hypothetical protein